MSHPFQAGRLHYFVHEWHAITSDPNILDIVQHCHLDIDVAHIGPLFAEEVEYVFNVEEKEIFCWEIVQHLSQGVIKETQRQEGQILSPIF